MILALAAVIIARPAPLAAADPQTARKLTAADWREDLRFLYDELVEIHPGVFERTSQEQFERAVEELDDAIPGLSPDQILVGFSRIVALIPDAHTVPTSQDRREELFSYFPVRLIELSDGVFVLAAERRHAGLVGSRVVTYGERPIDEALARFAEIIPADSDLAIEHKRALEMMSPHLAHGLGLVADRSTLPLTVEHADGTLETAAVGAIEAARTTSWYKDGYGVPGEDFVTIFDRAPGPLPVSLGHPGSIRGPRETFWFSWLGRRHALYVRFNAIRNGENETFAEFVSRMWKEFDRRHPDRLIIDLRTNDGGNNFLVKPLIHGLIERQSRIRPNQVYVLIGRGTFSAAVSTAAMLEREIGPVFVGEPTGQRPNHFSDTRAVVAPHSLFRVEISHYQWMFISPWDRRPYIAPQIPVEASSKDLLAGRDPVLERALSPDSFETIDVVLSKALDSGKSGAASDAYRRYKTEYPDRWSDTSEALNELGYRLLDAGRVGDAVTVFELNTGSYPENGNGWDSLGEAYLAAKRNADALRAYRRALELDPGNDHARRVVAELSSAAHQDP